MEHTFSKTRRRNSYRVKIKDEEVPKKSISALWVDCLLGWEGRG